MPKLSDDFNNRIRGTVILVRLYREDPLFEKELDSVCQPYLSHIRLATLEILHHLKDAIDIGEDDYKALVNNFKQKIGEKDATASDIQAYLHDLYKLAHQWKFTVPWSGWFLFLSKITDEIDHLGVKFKTTPSFHPHISIDLPPLQFQDIPAWLVMDMSKTELMALIGSSISEYNDMLKKKGLKERPSKLEKHAYWWFQYYVKEKNWKAIANEEALINMKGGLNPDNIQKAVKKFSKIISISH
jgi:hypothetical protein